MGIINHNSILVTTWKGEHVEKLRQWISGQQQKSLFLEGDGRINNTITFVLIPDGGKEGLDVSLEGDNLRQSFIRRLKEDDYSDGSSPWNWIEVGYGEFGQKILQGNCVNHYNDTDYAE